MGRTRFAHRDHLMQESEARRLRQLIRVQAVLCVVAFLIALSISMAAAASALIGAGASLAATLVAALWAFRDYRAQEPERILMRIYRAESARIAVALGIFATAFATFDGLDPLALLGGFLATQVAAPIIAAQLDTPPSRGSGE